MSALRYWAGPAATSWTGWLLIHWPVNIRRPQPVTRSRLGSNCQVKRRGQKLRIERIWRIFSGGQWLVVDFWGDGLGRLGEAGGLAVFLRLDCRGPTQFAWVDGNFAGPISCPRGGVLLNIRPA